MTKYILIYWAKGSCFDVNPSLVVSLDFSLKKVGIDGSFKTFDLFWNGLVTNNCSNLLGYLLHGISVLSAFYQSAFSQPLSFIIYHLSERLFTTIIIPFEVKCAGRELILSNIFVTLQTEYRMQQKSTTICLK